ncbi:hypothetical protein PR048_016912 [Dryococelus australis]|uniref:Uncharacterized protein n=1 Tax=Dryococelus australis TaxID=614101 RepID=A0ABQ9H810_9NEOP|nr:hypothetical protein PR048_016912 [Dryococelus australis]
MGTTQPIQGSVDRGRRLFVIGPLERGDHWRWVYPDVDFQHLMVSLLASHQGNPGSIPVRVTGFSQVGLVPDDVVGRRVLSGISCSPRPFIPVPLHTHLRHPRRLSTPPILAPESTSPRELQARRGGITKTRDFRRSTVFRKNISAQARFQYPWGIHSTSKVSVSAADISQLESEGWLARVQLSLIFKAGRRRVRGTNGGTSRLLMQTLGPEASRRSGQRDRDRRKACRGFLSDTERMALLVDNSSRLTSSAPGADGMMAVDQFQETRSWGSGYTVRLLASRQGEPGSIPGRVTPGFSQVEIMPDDAPGGRVFLGTPPYSPRFTLIGSQDLAKNRSNLTTEFN